MATNPQTRPKTSHNTEVVVDNWRRESVLGSGAFGVISLWRNVTTNERIALKECRLMGSNEGLGISNSQRERWKQEVEIMHRLRHPNVVKAIKVPSCLEMGGDLPALGMEFCSGGDLRKLLSKPEHTNGLTEDMVRPLLAQISSALLYLHSNRIIHRDLKPENIVIKPLADGTTHYKLIDLGYSKELDQSSLASSFVGTLQYLAPELFISKNYTSAVDNWSFGLLTHEVLTGHRPFLPNMTPAQWIPTVSKKNSSDIAAVIDPATKKVKFLKEISSYNQVCSVLKTDLESWLRTMLEWDPKKRGGKTSFQTLNELILKKPIVKVFVSTSLQFFSYEVRNEMLWSELKVLIESNTQIPSAHQLLISKRVSGEYSVIVGRKFDGDLVTKHIELVSKDLQEPLIPMLYVFNSRATLNYAPYTTTSIIPPTVEEVLLNPTKLVTYDEHKEHWKAFLWVAQSLIKKVQSLKCSHDQFMESNKFLLEKVKYSQLSGQVQSSLLLSTTDFVTNDIQYSMDRLKGSNDVYEHRNQKEAVSLLIVCEKALTDVSNQNVLVGQMTKFMDDLNDTTKRNLSTPSNLIDDLQSGEAKINHIHGNMLKAYNDLRRMSKEERSKICKAIGSNHAFENTLAVKHICDLFQLIEQMVKRIYVELNQMVTQASLIITRGESLEQLLVKLDDATTKLNGHRSNLMKALWELAEASLSLDSETQINVGAYSSVCERVEKLQLKVSLERKQHLATPEIVRRTFTASPGALSTEDNSLVIINSVPGSPNSNEAWSIIN